MPVRNRRAASLCAVAAFAVLSVACSGDDDTDSDTTASPSTFGAQSTFVAPTTQLPRDVSSTLSVDADPASTAPNETANHALDRPFDVIVILHDLGEPAAGYQIDISWNSSIVAFVSLENAASDAFPTCSPTLSAPSSASMYCLRTDGETEYTGPIVRLRLRCVAAGETPIELRPPGPEVVGTKIESDPSRNVIHQLALHPATITCD